MSLHGRIAEVLGWTEAEARSFSLLTLRDIVRPVSAKLTHEINLRLTSPLYIHEPSHPHQPPAADDQQAAYESQETG